MEFLNWIGYGLCFGLGLLIPIMLAPAKKIPRDEELIQLLTSKNEILRDICDEIRIHQ